MKSIDKYDNTKGCQLSTYATYWIKDSILRAIYNKSRIIRVPTYMNDLMRKLNETKRTLTQELHCFPTIHELASALEITIDNVVKIEKASYDTVSLDTLVGDDNDSTLGDFIKDESVISSLEHIMDEEYNKMIDSLLKTLPPKEEKILRLRFGFIDNEIETLENIGTELGITRERVRQLETRALRKLHKEELYEKIKKYRYNEDKMNEEKNDDEDYNNS